MPQANGNGGSRLLDSEVDTYVEPTKENKNQAKTKKPHFVPGARYRTQ
jgi:hypothetical protein